MYLSANGHCTTRTAKSTRVQWPTKLGSHGGSKLGSIYFYCLQSDDEMAVQQCSQKALGRGCASGLYPPILEDIARELAVNVGLEKFYLLLELMSRQAPWNPCQIPTQNVNRECRKHEDCSCPEAPVTMHPSPVRTGIGLAPVAAISFLIVLASGHLFSTRIHSFLSS
jgi:hypothetical protein